MENTVLRLTKCNRLNLSVFIFFLLNVPMTLFSKPITKYIGFGVDYKNYLSKHDVVFRTPNYEGFEGLTIGNGDIGGMIWCTNSGLKMQINKSDLYDQPNGESNVTLRSAAQLSLDFGLPAFEWLYLEDFEARMEMYNATSTFRSKTPFSTATVNAWVDANDNVWVLDCDFITRGQLQSGSSLTINLERWGSRVFPGWYGGYSKNTSAGLGKSKVNIANGDIYLKENFGNLEFVVVCRVVGVSSSSKIRNNKSASLETCKSNNINAKILVSVVTSNESNTLLEDAIRLLDKKEKEIIDKGKIKHNLWWEEFWERSFINIPDDYVENLYYYRRYLTACASRSNYPIVFNGSLWTWNHDHRQWCTPHHWNTQEQYWGLAVQNDCDLMLPYINTYFRLMPYAQKYAKERGVEDAILWSEAHDFLGNMVYRYREDMVNNFTPASQISAIFWEYYQFTGDQDFLRGKCYPFIKKAAQFYVGYLKWNNKKKEYYSSPSQPYEHSRNNLMNSSTDLFMLSALLGWCINAANILKMDADKIKEWKHIKEHLWEPPIIDVPNIGRVFGTAYTVDGKPYPDVKEYNSDQMYHFDAHTTQVYPSNLLGLDDKDTQEFGIIRNLSAIHPDNRNAITPGVIVSARIGDGYNAFRKIKNIIRHQQHFPQGLFYNIDHWYLLSRYADSIHTADVTCQRDYIYDKRIHYNTSASGNSGLPTVPFVQCGMEPLSNMSTALSEMLIQSHEKKIRVFPAVTDDWEGAFVLRSRGAFIVSSSVKKNHKVEFIGIKSLNGNICKIQSPWPNNLIEITDIETQKKISFKISEDGVLSFKTSVNGRYLIINRGDCFVEDNIYTAKKNMEPKVFKEAILGSRRDF